MLVILENLYVKIPKHYQHEMKDICVKGWSAKTISLCWLAKEQCRLSLNIDFITQSCVYSLLFARRTSRPSSMYHQAGHK